MAIAYNEKYIRPRIKRWSLNHALEAVSVMTQGKQPTVFSQSHFLLLQSEANNILQRITISIKLNDAGLVPSIRFGTLKELNAFECLSSYPL